MNISNVNTISALIDRLIIENLKMIKFLENKDDRASLQQLIIDDLREELEGIFKQIKDGKYAYRQECRTFTHNLMRLCFDNYQIAKYDNLKLEDDLELSQLRAYTHLVRDLLEDRAAVKNKIDDQFLPT